MFEVDGLKATYAAVQAVREATFKVGAGEVLAVLGPNGAGKSTLANAIAGLHKARAGLALVPQGRRVFGSCTVAEHVKLAGAHAGPGALPVEDILDLFPKLSERWSVKAHQLSGGEQQMLALARAVLLGPRVLVLDEPTEGLAPSIVTAVANLVRLLRSRGMAVVLMEQTGPFPDALADRVVTMDRGVVSVVHATGTAGSRAPLVAEQGDVS
jgi:branched-chain amino acid transport system ATP-binding protein